MAKHRRSGNGREFELMDGEMNNATGPGLGVTLNWDAIAKYRTGGR